MEKLFIKLGMIQSFNVTLDITHELFVKRFRKNVESGDISVFYDTAELFSSNKALFIGSLNTKRFKIRKKTTFLNRNYIIAEGTIEPKETTTLIHIKLNGYSIGAVIAYIAVFLVFLVLLFAMITAPNAFLFIGIVVYTLVMIAWPYLSGLQNVSALKSLLLEEFQRIVSND